MKKEKPKPETRVMSHDRFTQKWLRREMQKRGWREQKVGNTVWMVSP